MRHFLLTAFCTAVAATLVSCGNSNVFDCKAVLVTADNTCTISGEEVQLTGGPAIGGILDLQVVDPYLIIDASTKENSGLFHVYDKTGNLYSGSFINKGRGANELLQPTLSGTYRRDGHDIPYIFDLSLCRTYGFDVSESVINGSTQLYDISIMPNLTLKAKPVLDSMQFAVYPQPDGIFGEVLDMNGHSRKKIAIYPELSGHNYASKLSSPYVVFQGTPVIAITATMLPQVNFLNIATGERYTSTVDKSYRKWEKSLTLPNTSQTMYYMDATTSDRLLFALYYCAPLLDWAKGDFEAHLHIFDIEGNFLYEASLQEQIKTITYDSETGCLYGADQNDRIYRYDLSELKL